MIWLFTAALLALLPTWSLTPWVGSIARRLQRVEIPDSRTPPADAMARVGGVAIVIASFAVAWSLFVFVNHFSQRLPQIVVPLTGLSLGIVGVFLLGLLDDVVNINKRLKLLCLLAIACGVGLSGVRIPDLYLPGVGVMESLWITTPLSVVWLISICVAMNFIDGIDGLAGALIALTAGVIAFIATVSGEPFVAIVSCTIAGATLGFLRHNWPTATISLGECGSTTLGFALAGLALVLANRTGNGIVYAAIMLALAVPLFDTSLTFFRRAILERRSLFSAERGHVHHRLIDAGLTVHQTLRVLLAVTFVSASAGVLLALRPAPWTVAVAALSLMPVLTLFRAAGSVRMREMIAALRGSIRRSRDNERYNKAFEEMQVRFRAVTTFDCWWDELCEAGRRLQITSIDLICTNRDGTKRELNWSSPECGSRTHGVQLSLPVPQRRIGSPIDCCLSVSRNGSLESVGYRMSLFGRLLESHGLAALPKDSPIRLNRQSSVLRLAGLTERVASLGHSRRLLRDQSRNEPLPGHIDQPVQPAVENIAPYEHETAMSARKPRVAVVHDFLYIYGGAERVLENILAIYPDADLFSLFDFLDPQQRSFIGDRRVTTSFIQRLPFARRYHRHYLGLMPMAIEQLDMTGYDIVISSSYLAAKGVMTGPDQLHVCYCHTPARYAWDLQEQCLDEAGMKQGVRSVLARLVLHYIRGWDLRSSHGVDAYVTNSDFVRRRVKKVYGREATTIYPPVDVTNFALCEEKEDFYLTASRMVPYKKIALIAEAFTKMPDKRLVIIGDGPEFAAIRAKCGPNVILKGFLPKEEMVGYMQRAKAFVFAAIEDFGIVPVEAQACGTPVIALNRGGLCESIIDGETGILFEKQTPESIIHAVLRFEAHGPWDPHRIRSQAMKFSTGRFQAELSEFIEDLAAKHFAGEASAGAIGEDSFEMTLVEEKSARAL
jgi:UDP-N-acetylmuramyl pentapeptide phosphotransferase/UDP-N-acetylglucosamine-1-phosphate transferase/glycosyltransferase involved in cell wall biosynthesis